MIGGGVVILTLSPAVILGWGPVPRLGIAGAGLALITYYSAGSLVLLGYLLSGRGLVRLTVSGVRFRRALFWEILRVGAPGSFNTILTNLNVALLTSRVGPFGTFALAGDGLGVRLEYLQIPLVFGFGSALVTMVGTNIGAGYMARAQRAGWVGAGLEAAVTGGIGLFRLCGALFPQLWLGLFSTDAAVLATGTCDTQIKDLPIFPHDKPTHQTSQSVEIILDDSALSDDSLYTPVTLYRLLPAIAFNTAKMLIG